MNCARGLSRLFTFLSIVYWAVVGYYAAQLGTYYDDAGGNLGVQALIRYGLIYLFLFGLVWTIKGFLPGPSKAR